MAGPPIHLHTHSHFSFLDGASSPLALAERAAAVGQDALALTDWGGVYGAIAFDRACRGVGVRPIHGAEIALADGRHLTLLVKDAAGWRSLCRLLTAAQLAGAKGHAPVAPETLAAHTAGLVCLTGCRHGALAAPLLAGDDEAAWRAAAWLRALFGDDLWVELPRNDHPDDRTLTHRLAASRRPARGRRRRDRQRPLRDARGRAARRCARLHQGRHVARRPPATCARIIAITSPTRPRWPRASPTCPRPWRTPARSPRAAPSPSTSGRTSSPPCRSPAGRTPDEALARPLPRRADRPLRDGDPATWHRAVAQLDHELAVIADARPRPLLPARLGRGALRARGGRALPGARLGRRLGRRLHAGHLARGPARPPPPLRALPLRRARPASPTSTSTSATSAARR